MQCVRSLTYPHPHVLCLCCSTGTTDFWVFKSRVRTFFFLLEVIQTNELHLSDMFVMRSFNSAFEESICLIGYSSVSLILYLEGKRTVGHIRFADACDFRVSGDTGSYRGTGSHDLQKRCSHLISWLPINVSIWGGEVYVCVSTDVFCCC